MSRGAAYASWAIGASTLALAACRVLDNSAAVYGGPPIPFDAGVADAEARETSDGAAGARMIGPPER